MFSDPGTRAACLLTGCKNVSPIRRLDENHAEATDWGITLELALHEGTDAVGIRMHSICPGPGKNAILCRVAEVIENPFSVTVMLRPETGHTHQLRVLLNYLGSPIVGDDTYPVDKGLALYDFSTPLALVATSLWLSDPFTGKQRRFSISRDWRGTLGQL